MMPIVRGSSMRRAAGSTLALAVLLTMALVGGPALAQPQPTTSLYEWTADPATLYNQGCSAASADATGVIILDYGRPAYQSTSNAYGTINFNGSFNKNSTIDKAMKSFADGFHACNQGGGATVSLARGTNNSCSNADPHCCPNGCQLQPLSFTTAGKYWASHVNKVAGYLVSNGYRSQTSSAGDDAEPAWDPEYSNSGNFVTGYANAVAPNHAMWDYGSLDPGWWTNQQMWTVAGGLKPNHPFGEIYFNGMQQEWQALDQWAVQNEGRPMTIMGVLTTPCQGCYTPTAAYNAMLSELQSDPSTYQSAIKYLSSIEWASGGAAASGAAFRPVKTASVRAGRLGTQASLGGVPVPFPAGLFRPANMWLGSGVSVYAGALGKVSPSPDRGVLFLVRRDPQTGWATTRQIDAPRGTGTLTLRSVSKGVAHFTYPGGGGTLDLATGKATF